MPSTSPDPRQRGLTVLYDGACPLCSREIAWYRRQGMSEPVRWIDVAHCTDAALPPGVDSASALSRFHVLEADGHTYVGAAAFARLWAAHPRLAPLAWIARRPGVLALMQFAYRLFLRLRPWLTRRRRLLPRPDSGGPS